MIGRLLKALRKVFKRKTRHKARRRPSRKKHPARPAKRLRKKKPARRISKKIIKKTPANKSANKKTTKVSRKSKQRNVKKTNLPKKILPQEPAGELVGEITHYFSKIMVVVLKVTAAGIHSGDFIRIKGNGTDFTQRTASLQIESVDVKSANKGQLVGLKVIKPAREGDKVYKIR